MLIAEPCSAAKLIIERTVLTYEVFACGKFKSRKSLPALNKLGGKCWANSLYPHNNPQFAKHFDIKLCCTLSDWMVRTTHPIRSTSLNWFPIKFEARMLVVYSFSYVCLMNLLVPISATWRTMLVCECSTIIYITNLAANSTNARDTWNECPSINTINNFGPSSDD